MLRVFHMLKILMIPCLLLSALGCSRKISSLLLERKARGQVAACVAVAVVAGAVGWTGIAPVPKS